MLICFNYFNVNGLSNQIIDSLKLVAITIIGLLGLNLNSI
jgi:hypothetical protein